MTTARVELPPKLLEVFSGPARFRGAYGGRGSGKTRSFAKMAALKAYQWSKEGREGVILCGREFMNSLEDSSMEEIKAAILSEPWLAPHFDIGDKYIRTADKRIRFLFAGLRRNLDSIKSKARILILWVDEAEPVSETAWQKAIPSVRGAEDAEIWVTWNPERDNSPTHKRFRDTPPTDAKIVEINWQDNPWFPSVLNKARLDDKRDRPDQYDHVWGGDFKNVFEGAYFAEAMTQAKAQGRISEVSIDPLMSLRAYWDIGGTGAKADATAIWVCQFIGQKINVLSYYEAQGQDLATHVSWLRNNGFSNAECFLPHDGAHSDKIFDTSYEGSLRAAGFSVRVVPNQGRGAAMQRVEASRRWFPRVWFDNQGCEPSGGLKALRAYHEKRDEERGIGLGPCHDWSSHGADAFGLMCSTYEPPRSTPDRLVIPSFGAV